ncbi:DUF7279 family protein [Photorhabdus cinerea]|uniref:Uncharacterized protein n=1 Tax=Photorhabdus cinerea TaxID=471575 RepID=A0A7X5TJZ6_9GAMM|nr:hypothetical protein [Photorhabdus cinerea]NHB94834.1 hypothetical protein [Photorhabdus cinerea]
MNNHSYPVDVSVYYYRNWWVLKISVDWDDDIFLFPAKPTKRQIRKFKKNTVKWLKQGLIEINNGG